MIMVDGAADGYEDYLPLRDGQPTTPIADESRGLTCLLVRHNRKVTESIRRPLPGDAIDTTDALLSLVSLVYQFDDKTSYLSPAPLYHAAPLRYNMAVQQLGGTLSWKTSIRKPPPDREIQNLAQPMGTDHVRAHAETPGRRAHKI